MDVKTLRLQKSVCTVSFFCPGAGFVSFEQEPLCYSAAGYWFFERFVLAGTNTNLRAYLQREPNLHAFLTLFSFGTIARATQFLIPLIIYGLFPKSGRLDFYFYWTTQSNLVAVFLSAVWPSILVSQIVKQRESQGDSSSRELSGFLFRRYCWGAFAISFLTAVLALCGALGGPPLPEGTPPIILLATSLTIFFGSLSIALSEMATAHRRFGIMFQSLIVAALVQIAVIAFWHGPFALEFSFFLGSVIQLACSLWLLRGKLLKALFRNGGDQHSVLPSKRSVAFVYIGSFFGMLTTHFAFRILGNDSTGTVSAFALANMLAAAPQQLVIQHLSSVAAVALSETFQRKSYGTLQGADFKRVSTNWRNRLFRSSLLMALLLVCGATLLLSVGPMFLQPRNQVFLVAGMVAFLTLPLAVSGLSTWNARMTATLEKFEAGVYFQAIINLLTITLLWICAPLPAPFSSPMALAVASLATLALIPIYQRKVLKD